MSDSQTEPKTYSSPKLNKVTSEQAKLLLLGHATQGDQGAKDLLDVLFPDRTNTKSFPTHQGGRARRFRDQEPFESLPVIYSRIDAYWSVLTSFLNRLMRPCTKCMRIA